MNILLGLQMLNKSIKLQFDQPQKEQVLNKTSPQKSKKTNKPTTG